MPKSVRELLDEHITNILAQLDPVRAQVAVLERELADARRARAAITSETASAIAETNVNRLLRVGGARPVFYGGGEARDLTPPESPYAQLTMKQLVRKALGEHFPNGATAAELMDFFADAWGRNDIVRTSLSPQLSRLKREGDITLRGKTWYLADDGGAPDDRNENGAPATLPLDAPEAGGAATPSNHQPERTHW